MKDFFRNIVLFLVFCVAFSSLTGCAGTQPTNKAASDALFPLLRPGLAEAPFELLDGKMIKVSERKGKVLLLNIWGIWCGPCRAEMPHLVELQTKHGEKGFEILGLNIGDRNSAPENVDAIKKFSEEMKLNYTLARSAQPSTDEFYRLTKQRVVPQTILVDREGRLRGVFVGGGLNVINSMKASVEKALAEG